MKKYIVELTAAQRKELSHMISTGKASARELTHARILLKADQGSGGRTGAIGRSRKPWRSALPPSLACADMCAERGVQEAILPAKASAMRRRRLDGSQEAYLIAMVCGTPPEGLARWTLRVLAEQLVELGYVETISHETVRQVLLANELKPWIKKQWCIPTAPDAEFVYHMEDVLARSIRARTTRNGLRSVWMRSTPNCSPIPATRCLWNLANRCAKTMSTKRKGSAMSFWPVNR